MNKYLIVYKFGSSESVHNKIVTWDKLSEKNLNNFINSSDYFIKILNIIKLDA